MLLAHHGLTRTAFGSHNIRSLAHAMALWQLWEIPGTDFELQMLYGMGDPIKQAAVEMGQRCRIYIPYGDELAGMAYLIRRLLENTANESFLRHSVSEDTPVEALLSNPAEIGRRTPPREKPPVLKYESGELIMDPFENVPHTPFGREENRQRMRTALARTRTDLGREYPLIIGGQRVTTGQWSESRNPAQPTEVVGRVARADGSAAERAVQAASSALRSWRLVPPRQRADLLARVAEIVQRRRFELAALLCLECGMPWREADAEVSQAIDLAGYYGKEMIRLAAHQRRRDMPGETNEYYYAPRGVVAAITPWSSPLAAPTGIVCAALVTGNTVVLKPATPAGVAAAALMEILEHAGVPPGAVNYLPGPGPTVGEMLVTHPQVATVAFGGSRTVGCRIYRLAAEHPTARPALRRVIAAMGGKNSILVDSDADVDEAIKGVVASSFGCAGQNGSACSRCIVVEPLYERFADRLVEASRSLTVGPAEDPASFVPPLIDRTAWESVRQYVEIGRHEARCVLEVDVREQVDRSGGGFYVGPTIFADVPPAARIAQEEIFGPVLALIRARDFDQAVEIFNGTEYAWTGGIYSRSPSHIERARAECQCGNLFINRRITGARVDLQPLGGLKMSGLGAPAGGPDYLVQFCESRCVTENTLRRGFAPSEEFVEARG
jgi:RHH-type proline utilization regulon transcriptional repressor/proline dehydrogenase/delta 1-pyrroline-5-carboxylate dehydrogenase